MQTAFLRYFLTHESVLAD